MNLLVLRLVQIAKLHSCRNSQNFWDNELTLSPPWFFLWLFSIIQVLHHRETVLYHLVQLKPSKSYELRVSYPSTVLYFEFCFVWDSQWTCGVCQTSDHKIQLQATDESKYYVCEQDIKWPHYLSLTIGIKKYHKSLRVTNWNVRGA